MKIHHFGYLVADISTSLVGFEKLGYIADNIVLDNERNVYICFIRNEAITIELISPANENSVVHNMMKRYKNLSYHICYETNNIEETIEKLVRDNYMVISPVAKASAIDNKKVAFLAHADVGMIELVENIEVDKKY